MVSSIPIRIRRQNDADPIEFGQPLEIITDLKILLTENLGYFNLICVQPEEAVAIEMNDVVLM
jgi:hypothetical protein